MKVGIIGASGYTGAELMRLLAGHPHLKVTYVAAHTYAGAAVDELYPHLHDYASIKYKEHNLEEALSEAGLFFVALPHGEAMQVVPSLLEAGAKVVDLSADYRFGEKEIYEKWYGVEHTSPSLLPEAVYGLPEIFAGRIAGANLVAVPGCYPTAALLALAPLAERGYLKAGKVVVDAKSGLSGAGRSLTLDTHYPQAEGSVKPYNVGAHRHIPEMEEVLSSLAGAETKVTFTPHLVPMSRGILATCYVPVESGVEATEIAALYEDYYAGSPFVILRGEGRFPATKSVCGSNYCHLGWFLDGERGVLTVASAIDNLVKGASGQAVQCMNIMQGWPEETGLLAAGLFP